MGRRFAVLSILLALIFAALPFEAAFAGGGAGCKLSCHNGSDRGRSGGVTYEDSETTTTTTSGGGGGNKRDERKNKPELKCTTKNKGVISIKANWARRGVGGTQCVTGELDVDSCSGQFVGVRREKPAECPEQRETGDESSTTTWTRIRRYTEICNTFEVSMTSFSCATEFDLEANVSFPGVPIHTRPYPATLVRYDTFVRIGDLPSNSGSASVTYIAWEGGSETEPARGDWRFVTLKITAYPKDPKTGYVYLEHLGWLELPIMELYKFHWQLPSHPEGGGGPLAGSVGQLQELPQDLPLLENYMRNPYGVVCELSWQEWEYNPYTGEEGWIGHTDRQEITPDMVPNLPAEYAADTDGDGKADAFWNMGVVVLRMNEANSIDDPIYAHSYSWGEVFYWGVREGQGQITFP
jgi:hypothetical protein